MVKNNICSEDKNTQLGEILSKLAKDNDTTDNQKLSKDVCRDYINKFRLIYSAKEFKHSRVNIFGTVAAIHRGDGAGDITTLSNNLQCVLEYCKQTENCIEEQLDDLFDYVKLDIARIEYIEGQYISTLQQEIDEAKSDYKQLSDKAERLKKDISNANEKIKDAQKNNIAILSIFAAVILSCAGGFTFTSSVLSNIHQASAYRITFAIIAIALVVINIFHALFGYLSEIISLTANVKFSWVNCANNILCAMLAILCLLWCCGAVEKRNARILGNPQTAVQTQQKSSAK